MTSPDRHTLLAREIARKAGEYISMEAEANPLITVTRVDLAPDFSQAMILVSVLPEDGEEAALNFLKRHRTDFRSWIAHERNFKRIPFFDFAIDFGEKNRRDIEGVL